jgi:hypothetical protein
VTRKASRVRLIPRGGGSVKKLRIVLAIGATLAWAGVSPVVNGQEVKQQPPDLRMMLTQPQNRVSQDSTAVPNLRDVPMPKIDKPPVAPPVTIIVDDGRCYPGEDGMGSVGQFNRRPRRH